MKVLLLNSFFTLEKDGVKWSASAFKILPPFKLPDDLDRAGAKIFFDDIKVSKKFKAGQPTLSWWLIQDIKRECIARLDLPHEEIKPTPAQPSANKAEESKTHASIDSTKPSTIKNQRENIEAEQEEIEDALEDQLAELQKKGGFI